MKNWAWSVHTDNSGDKADSLGLIRSHLHCLFHCQSPDVTGTSENRGGIFFPSDWLFLRAWPAEINSHIPPCSPGEGRIWCSVSLPLIEASGVGGASYHVPLQTPSWNARSYLILQVRNINCSRTNALQQSSSLGGLLYHELSPPLPAWAS